MGGWALSDIVHRRIRWAFAAVCLVLIAWLLWRDFDADVMWDHEQVNIELGLWSTRFLIAVLAVSPLAGLLREPGLKRLRRPLGLGAAAFTAVHAAQYLGYSQAWPGHLQVLVERPYLTIGVIALVLLAPLAATSANAAVQRLGPKRWKALHRLLYAAAPLAVLHELMAWSNPFGEVGVHTLLISGLLAWRAAPGLRRARARPAPHPVAAE